MTHAAIPPDTGVAEPTDTPVIRTSGLTKDYGPVLALDTLDLQIGDGVTGLVGANGAGKSTLIKSLAGIHTPDEGQILFRDAHYVHTPPKPNEKQKVSFIHQDLGLVEWMTVAENVGLAQGYSRRSGLIDWGRTEQRAADALRLVGCDFDPNSFDPRQVNMRIQLMEERLQSLATQFVSSSN